MVGLLVEGHVGFGDGLGADRTHHFLAGVKGCLVSVALFPGLEVLWAVVASEDKEAVVEGVVVVFVLLVRVEGHPFADRATVVVVLGVVLLHVVAELHLLSEVLPAANTTFVDVLRPPGPVLVLAHVLNSSHSMLTTQPIFELTSCVDSKRLIISKIFYNLSRKDFSVYY